MRNNIQILVITALATFLLSVGCSKPEAKRTPGQSSAAAAPQGIVEEPKAAPAPAVSRMDNSSSGPRRLGEPVPLPRARDDKEREFNLTGEWEGPDG